MKKSIVIVNHTKNAKSPTQKILKTLYVKSNPHQCFHVKYEKQNCKFQNKIVMYSSLTNYFMGTFLVFKNTIYVKSLKLIVTEVWQLFVLCV